MTRLSLLGARLVSRGPGAGPGHLEARQAGLAAPRRNPGVRRDLGPGPEQGGEAGGQICLVCLSWSSPPELGGWRLLRVPCLLQGRLGGGGGGAGVAGRGGPGQPPEDVAPARRPALSRQCCTAAAPSLAPQGRRGGAGTVCLAGLVPELSLPSRSPLFPGTLAGPHPPEAEAEAGEARSGQLQNHYPRDPGLVISLSGPLGPCPWRGCEDQVMKPQM